MREEGLVPRKAAQMRRRARYSSYAGECGERAANPSLREGGAHDSRAAEPGLPCVADVTEFRLGGFKAYLGAAVDCLDGWPVCRGGCPRAPTRGWRSARSGTWSPPCARRRRARRSCTATGARRARCRARPGARTTRGARGFFGTLKSDFFHGTDWRGVTFAEFRERLGAHVEWHGGGKPKKALGWRTLREHRTALGYAA
jgi:hypothetical protein